MTPRRQERPQHERERQRFFPVPSLEQRGSDPDPEHDHGDPEGRVEPVPETPGQNQEARTRQASEKVTELDHP